MPQDAPDFAKVEHPSRVVERVGTVPELLARLAQRLGVERRKADRLAATLPSRNHQTIPGLAKMDRLLGRVLLDAVQVRDFLSRACLNHQAGEQLGPIGALKEYALSYLSHTIETNGILVITTAQLLANDSDADSDPLEIVDVSKPEVGRLAFNQTSNLVYRPVEGFIGLDSFKYTATDNKGAAATATATVKIKVREPEVVSLSKLQLVNFIYDEAELTEVSKTRVAAIIEQIKLATDITIEIYTYTDNIGSDAYNEALSARRARALEDLLVSNGIDRETIKAVGMGEKNPIADNSTEAGQAINRRGEFIFKATSAVE